MSARGWTLQSQSAVDGRGRVEIAPTDACGLARWLEGGWTWMNQHDGRGWRQTAAVLREIEHQERVRQLHAAGAREVAS